jgi:hypothetical protein
LNYYNSSDVIYLDYRDIRVHRNRVVSSDILNRWFHVDDCRYSDKIEDHLFSGKWESLNQDIENSDLADLKRKKIEKFRELLVERNPLRSFLSRREGADGEPEADIENDASTDTGVSEAPSEQVDRDHPTDAGTESINIQEVRSDIRNRYSIDAEQEISRLLRQELASHLRSSITIQRNRRGVSIETPVSLLNYNPDEGQDITPESQG